MWFIGVEVEQETSAPPPKKNPGSAPERPTSGFKSVYIASSILLYAFNLTARIVSVVFRRSMPIVLLQTKECCAWQIIICSFVTEKTGYKYWTKSLIKTPRKHQVGRMCSLPELASLVQLATNLLSVLKSNIYRRVL